MTTIVTRAGKGAALIYAEMDANFTNLNADKIETSEIGVSVQPYDATLLNAADIGVTVQGYDATILTDSDIGTSVQAYDADTAKLDVDQTWTGAQRGTLTTDNDGSFDQSVTNNFFCTPAGAVVLTFTNHTAGQSGMILFVNGSNYVITAAASTYISASDLTKLSATGTYVIAYIDNGTNAYCTVSAKLTSAGV